MASYSKLIWNFLTDQALSKDQIDTTTNSLKIVRHAHEEIHEGSHYFNKGSVDLANGATKNILIITPDTTEWGHFTFSADAQDGEVSVEIFEDTTVTVNGTAANVKNRNRNFPDSSSISVFEDPTITTPGNSFGKQNFGSGKTFGGGDRDNEEIVLKQNTIYLFRLINETVSLNMVNWGLDWYEHTNAGG